MIKQHLTNATCVALRARGLKRLGPRSVLKLHAAVDEGWRIHGPALQQLWDVKPRLSLYTSSARLKGENLPPDTTQKERQWLEKWDAEMKAAAGGVVGLLLGE